MCSSHLTACSNQDAIVSFSASVISDEAALRDLEATWDRLSESSQTPNPFMTYGWYQVWVNAQLRRNNDGGTQPYVVVLKDGDEVAGIVPWVRRIVSRWLRVRRLQFATIHADYHDSVLGSDTERLIASFVDYLTGTADQWDVVSYALYCALRC